MARPAERFVGTLSDDDTSILLNTWKSAPTHRERCRAHAILISNQGKTVAEIADLFQVTMQTVYSWLDRWEDDGDLGDAPRSGAPPILSDQESEIALEELEKSPHNPQRVIDQVEKQTGKRISIDTLRRIAKAARFAWKRMRGSLRDRRDENAFATSQAEIGEFARMHQNRELNLWFFDEAAFSLTPTIPYAWQRIGETIELPFQRGQSISALGFVDLDSQFFSYEIEGSIDSATVVEVMNRFAESVSGYNVVVIDNAPVHRSKLFQRQIDRWTEQGVHLYFLPPYSPELNLIEIVWRRIKQQWLPLRAFRSLTDLWDELGRILAGIGNELQMNFSLPSLD